MDAQPGILRSCSGQPRVVCSRVARHNAHAVGHITTCVELIEEGLELVHDVCADYIWRHAFPQDIPSDAHIPVGESTSCLKPIPQPAIPLPLLQARAVAKIDVLGV